MVLAGDNGSVRCRMTHPVRLIAAGGWLDQLSPVSGQVGLSDQSEDAPSFTGCSPGKVHRP